MGSLLHPHPIYCHKLAPVISSRERGSPLPSGSSPCQNQLLLARGEVRELWLCHVCLQKVPTWHRHRAERRPSPCSPSSPVGRGHPGSCSCWKGSLPRMLAGSCLKFWKGNRLFSSSLLLNRSFNYHLPKPKTTLTQGARWERCNSTPHNAQEQPRGTVPGFPRRWGSPRVPHRPPWHRGTDGEDLRLSISPV